MKVFKELSLHVPAGHTVSLVSAAVSAKTEAGSHFLLLLTSLLDTGKSLKGLNVFSQEFTFIFTPFLHQAKSFKDLNDYVMHLMLL